MSVTHHPRVCLPVIKQSESLLRLLKFIRVLCERPQQKPARPIVSFLLLFSLCLVLLRKILEKALVVLRKLSVISHSEWVKRLMIHLQRKTPILLFGEELCVFAKKIRLMLIATIILREALAIPRKSPRHFACQFFRKQFLSFAGFWDFKLRLGSMRFKLRYNVLYSHDNCQSFRSGLSLWGLLLIYIENWNGLL